MGSGPFSGKVTPYDGVLDAVGQPATMIDVSGAVVSFNRAAAEAHGWTHSEIIGRNLLEVMPAMDRDSTTEPERWILSGRPWSGELRLNRPDGSTYPALVSVNPIVDEHGAITHLLATSSDLSQYNALQRRFQVGFETRPWLGLR